MNAQKLLDSLTSVTEACFRCIEYQHFHELFLVMQQRSELLQALFDSQVDLDEACRREILISTETIHRRIDEQIGQIRQQLDNERATAPARRAYAKSTIS